MNTTPLANLTIMLIEDDAAISKMYTKYLTTAGAVVLPAFDGATALRLLMDHPVNAVLLDLGMPGMNGYETLLHIREDPKTNALPVIILSNTTLSADRPMYDLITKAGVSGIFRKYETALKELPGLIADACKCLQEEESTITRITT